MTLQQRLREDILTILSKLDIKELELLKAEKRFKPSEVIDEAIKRKKEAQQNFTSVGGR